MAARTALEAVDAATAPEPKINEVQASSSATRASRTPPPSARPVVLLQQNLRPAAAAARAGVLAPLRRASRELWHELTGSFFALFALSFGVGVWHTRINAFSNVPAERYRFYAFCVLALLFAYFSVSSFARARHKR